MNLAIFLVERPITYEPRFRKKCVFSPLKINILQCFYYQENCAESKVLLVVETYLFSLGARGIPIFKIVYK